MSEFDIVSILKDRRISYKFVPGTNEVLMDCPVCGRKDHFYYNRKKNLCICQRCKFESNHIGFLIVGLGYTKKDASLIVFGVQGTSLAGVRGKIASLKKVGVNGNEILYNPVFFKNPFPKGLTNVSRKVFPRALSERGVSLRFAKELGIKICNKRGKFFNRIIFPITTLKTKTFTATSGFTKAKVAKVKETFKLREKEYRKSLFPFGSLMSEVLYLYNDLKKEHISILFVVEGIFDVLRIKKYGFEATATFGDKVSFSQAVLLNNLNVDEICLMLDGGVNFVRLWKYVCLLEEICFDKEICLCVPLGEKDPDELSKKEFLHCLNHRKIRGSLITKMSKKDAKTYIENLLKGTS